MPMKKAMGELGLMLGEYLFCLDISMGTFQGKHVAYLVGKTF